MGNSEGVFKARTIRRMPVENRWNFDFLNTLEGVPWKCNPQADEAEQVIQPDVPPVPADSPVVPPEPPPALLREEAPRKLYVKTDTLKKIGYTPGCPGCRALQEGRTRVNHNDQCREIAAETMKETVVGRERLNATRKREDEHLAREVERGDERAVARRKLDEAASSAECNGATPTVLQALSSFSMLPPAVSSSSDVAPSLASGDMVVSHSQGEKRQREFADVVPPWPLVIWPSAITRARRGHVALVMKVIKNSISTRTLR